MVMCLPYVLNLVFAYDASIKGTKILAYYQFFQHLRNRYGRKPIFTDAAYC